MSNLLLPDQGLYIPKQEQGERVAQIELGRREAVKLMAILAGTTAIAGNAEELFAKEDITKLSAAEALEKLPDRISLGDGKFADVEKCRALNPTQLIIVLRTLHDEPVELTALEKSFVKRSRAETKEVMLHLHNHYGVKYFSQEGYSYEEYIYKLLINKSNRSRKEEAMLNAARENLRKYRYMLGREYEEEKEADRIEYELGNNLPPGIYDGVTDGTLDITILPAEIERYYCMAVEEKMSDSEYVDPRIVGYNREDAQLTMAHRNIRAFTTFGTIMGADHYRKISEKEVSAPVSVHERNSGNKGGRFCTARVTTDSVREFYKLVEEGVIDQRFKPRELKR